MKPKKTLDELSNEALAAGMSYGQYVAMLEASRSSNNIPQNNSPGMTTRAERSKGGRTTGHNN